MAYKAVIIDVKRTELDITIQMQFTDGVDSYNIDYPFSLVHEISSEFNTRIQEDLKKKNEIEDRYKAFKAREGEEIFVVEE